MVRVWGFIEVEFRANIDLGVLDSPDEGDRI